MGYNTKFRGVLKFTSDLSPAELARLNDACGEDSRDHPEWEIPKTDYGSPGFYYLDLRLTKDFSGIEWNDDTEKTYGMDNMVAFVIRWMREVKPDFGLQGTLLAEGEDWDDRWRLIVVGTDMQTVKTPPQGAPVECPECEHKFIPEAS